MKALQHVTHGTVFLGRNRGFNPKVPALSNYKTSSLAYPAKVAWERPIVWQMLGNDTVGNCLVEGTQIAAPNIEQGLRMPYDGPVVTLVFDSGNRLTVTPHHAVLTPRGFLPAYFLKKGDHVISSAFPEQVARSLQSNFNDAPTTVEKKVQSLLSLPHFGKGLVMPLSLNFNGDEKFINGDIDVVGTNSFLKREFHPSLSKPYGKAQIRATSHLQSSLPRSRGPFHSPRVGRSSSLRFIGGSRESGASLRSHFGVIEPQRLGLGTQYDTGSPELLFHSPTVESNFVANIFHRLASPVVGNDLPKVRDRVGFSRSFRNESLRFGLRTNLQASGVKPSTDGRPTDPQLPSQLRNLLPGLITTENIREVYFGHMNGHVYDLGTQQRWYMANGIITHNCVIARLLHQIMGWFSVANAGQPKTFTTDQALQIYSAITGYVPGDPSTDQGTDPDTACAYWQNTGLLGDKIAGYANVDITNLDLIKFAIATFGGAGLAFDVPNYIMNVPAGGDWSETPGADTTIEGGHEVYLVGYGRKGFRVVSWGSTYTFNPDFLAKYGQNVDAVISPDWLKASGVSPTGLDLTSLLADLPASLVGQ
jgi:hypothetical protein